MKTNFVPCYDGEKAPTYLSTSGNDESQKRIELAKVPIGTVIEFKGQHPDSEYICKIVGSENERKIKIWFKGRNPCALAPIEDIVSFQFPISETNLEKGVMEVGKSYVLPHFYYDYDTPQGTKLNIDPVVRTEPYTKLFIKSP